MNKNKDSINMFNYDLFDLAEVGTRSISNRKSTQEEVTKSFVIY